MSLWSWVKRDGLLHSESCGLLCIGFDQFMPLWLAAVLAVIFGIGKELWDKKHGGVASWHDVICDIAGVVLVVLVKLAVLLTLGP